jgi:poly-gamma-glutamate synthesis protein (capsule biosynthesis protein)
MTGKESVHSRVTGVTALLAVGAFLGAAMLCERPGPKATTHAPAAVLRDTVCSLRLLAVGDINLGRAVGQALLAGDSLYPFLAVRDTFLAYDIVFGNLESVLSDQGGVTQDPFQNLVFCGPPEGARALRLGGVTIVSTANNHALDYGRRGRDETIDYLSREGVAFAGTSKDTARLFLPTVLERNGIRCAFFACAEFMNTGGEAWKKLVMPADSGRIFPLIRAYRDSVDFITLSYHGGDEYADQPSSRVVAFAHAALQSGADLFLGHHPHVPYSVVPAGKGLMAPSLGNFVFRQPARFWTQRSFGLSARIVKDTRGTRLASYACLPAGAGAQPRFLQRGADAESVIARVQLPAHNTRVEVGTW